MFEFIMALGCGLGGLVAGFWLRAKMQQEGDLGPVASNGDRVSVGENGERRPLLAVMEQLRRVTARVAADVDEHQTMVERASASLSIGGDDPDGANCLMETVSKLLRANEAMQSKLDEAQERIQEQAMRIQSAEEKASTDVLTRLNNRRALDERMKLCHRDAGKQPCTFMILDVDHFKKFNDNFGHLAGDEVLRRVGSLLRARLSEFGFAARYGGEEFAVIFEDREIGSCIELVEKTRRAIGYREFNVDGKKLRVKASLGLAQLRVGESIAEWIERADKALYRSKQCGRDCGHWMHDDRPERINIELDPLLDDCGCGSGPSDRTLAMKQSRDGQDAKGTRLGSAMFMAPGGSENPGETHKLPGEVEMHTLFERLAERLSAASVQLFVLVVHRDQPGDATAADPLILQVVRASTRSLDHIGQLDNGDVIVFMPSANEENCGERAQRIRASVEQESDPSRGLERTVSIGVTVARDGDTFHATSQLALELAQQSAQQGGNRVMFQRLEPVSSP